MNCKPGLAAISVAVALAGCGTCSGPALPPAQVETHTKVIDSACSWTKPIYLEKTDVLSDSTARAVLEHNRTGAKVCGWRPLAK
ncbi:hypothetical protein BX604_0349 [Burkholderia sp. JKS000303]|nr:hypothetical protein BX604_0349 [Burkholderia sp. JKS000303]